MLASAPLLVLVVKVLPFLYAIRCTNTITSSRNYSIIPMKRGDSISTSGEGEHLLCANMRVQYIRLAHWCLHSCALIRTYL